MMFLDVLEQRRDRKDESASAPLNLASQAFHHLLEVAGEQIVFVLIVRVEGRTAYVGPIANVLHRDRFVAFLLNQGDERARQGLSRALRAAIGWSIFGQTAAFCPLTDGPGQLLIDVTG